MSEGSEQGQQAKWAEGEVPRPPPEAPKSEPAPGAEQVPRKAVLLLHVQHLADFLKQSLQHEWLLEEKGPRVEDAMLDNGILRVPGHKNDLGFGTKGSQSFGELIATHFGHDDVRDDQMDWVTVLFDDGKRLFRASGLQHFIAL